MKKAVVALVTASVLVLSGCGSEEDEAVSAISDSLVEQEGGQTDVLSLEREEADCIAEGMVDGVGVDQLKEYGILTEENTVDEEPTGVEMSEADAEATTDALFECTDVKAMMDEQMATQLEGEDPQVQECVNEVLNDERLRNLFVALFQGEEQQAQQELMQPMMECATQGMGG